MEAHVTNDHDATLATTIELATSRTVSRAQTVRELHELIAALDRRVPQVQRLGELAIARAAAALRTEALTRIEELEREATRARPAAIDVS
jgi:hypothetical protein